MKQSILLQVRELLDKNWNVYEIAAKCNLDPEIVRLAIDIIQDILT